MGSRHYGGEYIIEDGFPTFESVRGNGKAARTPAVPNPEILTGANMGLDDGDEFDTDAVPSNAPTNEDPFSIELDSASEEGYPDAGAKMFRPDIVMVDDIGDNFVNKNVDAVQKLYPPYALMPSRDDVAKMMDYNIANLKNVLKVNQEPMMKFIFMVSAFTATDHTRFIETRIGGDTLRPGVGPFSKGSSSGVDMFGTIPSGRVFEPHGLATRPSTAADVGTLLSPRGVKRRRVEEARPEPTSSATNNFERRSQSGNPVEFLGHQPRPGPQPQPQTQQQRQYAQPQREFPKARFGNKWLNDFIEFESAGAIYGEDMKRHIQDYTAREGQAHLENWMSRPEVIGIIQLKDILVGAMEFSLDQLRATYHELDEVPMGVFVGDHLAAPKFAMLVGANLIFSGCLKGNRTIYHDTVRWANSAIKQAIAEMGNYTYNKRAKKFERLSRETHCATTFKRANSSLFSGRPYFM